MTKTPRYRRGFLLSTALIAASLLLGACSAGGAQGLTSTASPSAPATTTIPPKPAVLEVSPADLASGVLPDAALSVKASSGTLSNVKLADDQGNALPGETGPDGTWTVSGQLLHLSATYTFTISAIGESGTPTSVTSTFSTLKPAVKATYSLIPSGGTVGIGMPVAIQFASMVTTKAQRAEVEKRVKVTTVPAQEGAWGWLDNRQLMWRPKSYWVPGTTVTVSAPLHGLQTGESKWIVGDDAATFTIGGSMVSTVDTIAHTMVVRRNGAVIRSFKVSTGISGPLTQTRNGIKVVIQRQAAVVMDSATVALPPGTKPYKIDTKWNLRLTWTGEYIHSAPWSVGEQGTVNVSHGCTNMAPADAKWMFDNSRVGDIVKFTGSSRAFKPTEGIGVWVYDFAGWKAQSALV